tara:strand:+ start:246 stop:689 length:444 start_codon:yes stop_codon:yes gene_type:complete
MKLKNTYLIFTLLFIPGYIFYMPAINYIYNFNQITYSLSMPENNINNNSTQVTEHRDIEISDEIPLKQVISESWIISFPDITSEKLINDFLNNLKKIGITSIINLGSTKNIESIAIGPFVDKKMAENIAFKIKNSLSHSGNIERLSH